MVVIFDFKHGNYHGVQIFILKLNVMEHDYVSRSSFTRYDFIQAIVTVKVVEKIKIEKASYVVVEVMVIYGFDSDCSMKIEHCSIIALLYYY